MDENNSYMITVNMENLTDEERKLLIELTNKATYTKNQNYGPALIGREVKAGTKFRVINIEPHKTRERVCLNEYIGKTASFKTGFTFTKNGFHSTGNFDDDYMNAIDAHNGLFCWRYDEVEILD